jgi:hypothetical protein
LRGAYFSFLFSLKILVAFVPSFSTVLSSQRERRML